MGRARVQLEGALLEARAKVARLTFDRDELVAQAQRRQATADPAVLAQYREGFSDGTQEDASGTAHARTPAQPLLSSRSALTPRSAV